MTGPGAEGGRTVTVGGTTFHLLTLQTGEEPKPGVNGDQVIVGGQTIRFDGRKIVLGRMAGS